MAFIRAIWVILVGLSLAHSRAACAAGEAPAPISYALAQNNGRTVIRSSEGRAIPWSSYSVDAVRGVEDWAEKQAILVPAGIRMFQISIRQTTVLDGRKPTYWSNPFWSLDGQPVDPPAEAISIAGYMDWLVENVPDAHVVIRFQNHPDPAWSAEHCGEMIPLDRLTTAESKKLSIKPSLASELWMDGMERLIRDVVAWCERQPWRNRIVGYTIFPYGEGATNLACDGGYFDRSDAMQAAFRAFVRECYATDEALRAAWNDPDITLDTVRVPSDAEWLRKKKDLGIMHWPDPAKVRRERDYFLLQKRLFHRYMRRMLDTLDDATRARPVITGGDLLKLPMQGWLLGPRFFGEWYSGVADEHCHIMLASGAIGTGPLYDHPGLDMIQTPGMYYNRAMGYAWEAEGAGDTLALRGKVNYMEADMRAWSSRAKPHTTTDAGTFLTPAEARAGHFRTMAWATTRNLMYYMASVSTWDWWYFEEPIVDVIGENVVAEKASAGTPWRETEHAICLVIDDEAALYEDFSAGFQHLAVARQMEEGLALCGVPYRVHLFSDLAREDFPRYRCWLFPNLFRVDDEVIALLRKKVLRDGNVAIFGPGTGITDGKVRSADGASRLLGVPMELKGPQRGRALKRLVNTTRRVILQDHGHPMSLRLGTLTYGDSYPYGPLLVPVATRLTAPDTNAVQLGQGFFHYFMDRPGLFIHEFGQGARGEAGAARGADDYAVVFSAAVPLPPEVLRECARHGGCNIWSETGDVVYACDTTVALHTVQRGPRTVHLPRACRVVDLHSGECLGEKLEAITITVTNPPVSRVFILE